MRKQLKIVAFVAFVIAAVLIFQAKAYLMQSIQERDSSDAVRILQIQKLESNLNSPSGSLSVVFQARSNQFQKINSEKPMEYFNAVTNYKPSQQYENTLRMQSSLLRTNQLSQNNIQKQKAGSTSFPSKSSFNSASSSDTVQQITPTRQTQTKIPEPRINQNTIRTSRQFSVSSGSSFSFSQPSFSPSYSVPSEPSRKQKPILDPEFQEYSKRVSLQNEYDIFNQVISQQSQANYL